MQPVLEDGDGGGNGERQEPNDRQVAGTDAWDAGHDARGHDEAAVCEPPNLLALITRGPAAPDEEGGGAYEREQEDEQERALLDGDREAIGVRQAGRWLVVIEQVGAAHEPTLDDDRDGANEDRHRPQPGHGTPPPGREPAVGEEEQRVDEQDPRRRHPDPLAEPRRDGRAGNGSGIGDQTESGVLVRQAGHAEHGPGEDEDPPDRVRGTTGRQERSQPAERPRQYHGGGAAIGPGVGAVLAAEDEAGGRAHQGNHPDRPGQPAGGAVLHSHAPFRPPRLCPGAGGRERVLALQLVECCRGFGIAR